MSSMCAASPSAKSSVERVECSSYGSSEAPMTSSPRAHWLTYTCRLPETMIGSSQGLSGSRHHRLQRMDVDRRAQSDHVGDARRGAGDRAQHLVGRDVARDGVHARDACRRPRRCRALRCSGGSRRRAGPRRVRSPRPPRRAARSRRARDTARRGSARWPPQARSIIGTDALHVLRRRPLRESTPKCLLTSARQRIVRIAESVCASVKWPRVE